MLTFLNELGGLKTDGSRPSQLKQSVQRNAHAMSMQP